jgi:PAS domain S-box-containing protein
VAREKGFSVGNVEYDKSSRTYAISIGIRIEDAAGDFAGVMKAVMDTKGIVREAEMAAKKYATTRVQVLTRDGRLIYSTQAFQFLEDLSRTPFFEKMRDANGSFMVDTGGKEILYSYARSQGYRGFQGLAWILVVGHDVQEVLAPALFLRNRIVMVSLVLVLLAILIAIFMSRSITGPIANLARGAREIGQGHLDYRIPVAGRDEIGLLAASFNEMAGLRKREEETLRASEERFRSFFNTAAIGMVMGDTDGRFVQVNGAFCEIVGYDEKALIGRPFQSLVHPQDLKEELPHLTRLLEGEISQYHREERLIHREGCEVWVNVSVSLVRDKDGRPVNLIAGVENITELRQHRAHLEQMVEDRTVELTRSNQELQQFAYVASHDLQEPLRKVQAFGGRFAALYEDQVDEKGRDYLARMQGAGRRMGTMIQDLLSLSRVTTQGKNFVPVDLKIEAQKVLSDLEVAIDECGGLFEIGDLPTIEGDPSQIHQLLLNLFSNAVKYRKPGKSPLLRIYPIMGESLKGPLCHIHVEDDGIGFEEKYTDRIFESFQRLHGRSKYEGTGMGLAICRKIAERHGGSITARSAPGQGATFIVTLPVRIVD